MDYIKAFVTGGLLCAAVQILMDKTKLMPGRIIDSDYFYSDNEGHIFAKLTNDTNENKVVELKADTGFMQGIFVEYGITVDDDVTDVRNGGFGSTTK